MLKYLNQQAQVQVDFLLKIQTNESILDSCFTVTSNDNRTVVQGHGSSPFVELDEFLLGLMRPITSANAQIRSWSIIYSEFYHTRKIIYEV